MTRWCSALARSGEGEKAGQGDFQHSVSFRRRAIAKCQLIWFVGSNTRLIEIFSVLSMHPKIGARQWAQPQYTKPT